MVPKAWGLALALTTGAATSAAQAPGPDIFLATLTRRGAALEVGAPRNVTDRAGYDNQPSFAPDGGSFYYTSQRSGQTDIYRYDLASQTAVQVTISAESEYSPTVVPGGTRLSVIRVERDSTQRLWSMALDGSDPRLVLDAIKPVGYHAWLNADTVFVFVLGSPATLQRAFPGPRGGELVARDIGRTLFRIPGRHAVSYLQRDSAGGWIRAFDPATGQSEPLAPLPEDNEFYAWTPDGELLSARANQLLRWSGATRGWETLASFSEPGLARISRLAVSPRGDRIAIVGEVAR